MHAIVERQQLSPNVTRLVIEANWAADTPPGPLADLRALLDSIRIEP